MLLIKFLFFLLLTSGASASISRELPDHALTPGDVLTTDTKVICVVGYSKTVRDVKADERRAMFLSYGIPDTGEWSSYEGDHLISLELGGSNKLTNLWPQSYLLSPWNAYKKDTLENLLHRLVCNGTVPIEVAQKEIATDWIAAYEKYLPYMKKKRVKPQGT
jgi:hypothetical protein